MLLEGGGSPRGRAAACLLRACLERPFNVVCALSPLQIRREAAARVQEEEARQEAERQRLAREAARIERKKAKMEAALAAKAEDAERARAEKEALLKKLRAMEGKILKGERAAARNLLPCTVKVASWEGRLHRIRDWRAPRNVHVSRHAS